MRRRLLLLSAIIVILALAVTMGWVFTHKSEESTPFMKVVQTQRAPLSLTTRGSGYITMRYKTDLLFAVGGLVTELYTVDEIYVEEGDRVKKGQKLAKLSTSNLERDAALAQDVVESSQAKLKEAQNKYDTSYVADAESEIRNATFSFTHALAKHFVNTISPGVGRNILAPAEAPRGPLTCLIEYIDSWQQTLNGVFKEGDNIRRAVDSYEEIKETPEFYEVVECRAELTQAQNKLKDSMDKLEDATLRAPFDGVIDEITDIKEGDRISADTPIMRIIDPAKVGLEIKVDEMDILMIKEEQKASIFLDALPTVELQGKVENIPFASQREAGVVTYLVDISVELPPSSITLREGLSAVAEITILEKEDCLLIPIQAVKLTREGKTAEVLVDGQVEKRIITAGLTDGQRIEVLKGLREGEWVILDD